MKKIIATNRKAYYNYTIKDKCEAGIALTGSEIKSIRAGHVSLQEGYIHFNSKGHPMLYNTNIKEYEFTGYVRQDPSRPRMLLLHKKEIKKLKDFITKKGCSAIPLQLYLKGAWAKLDVGLGIGKKLHDKREAVKEKEALKEINRTIKWHASKNI